MAGKGAVSDYVFFNNKEQKFESPPNWSLLATIGLTKVIVLPRKQGLLAPAPLRSR